MNDSKNASQTGRISAFESMGGRDGPGLRFVVFMQGCPLRCIYCHNPETWDASKGTEYTVKALFQKIQRCKPYFGKNGGVTVSGGEPLLQQGFVTELFRLCKAENIPTALDTSGAVINEDAAALLDLCDLVLLDVKFTSEPDYLRYTGGSLEQTLQFLALCCRMGKKVLVRHVILPGINDSEENIRRLVSLCAPFSCITEIQLLPFSDLCREKYRQLGLSFPLSDTPSLDPKRLNHLRLILPKRLI